MIAQTKVIRVTMKTPSRSWRYGRRARILMGLNEELGQVFSRLWQRIVFHYMWYRMDDYQNAMVSASTLTKKFLCPLLMVLDTKKSLCCGLNTIARQFRVPN